MSTAREERLGLARAARSAGPDAPTLCEGWTVRDLVAHLVLRERRPDAAGGIMLPALAAQTERVQRQIAARDFETLLAAVESGPPWYSLTRPDRVVNLFEMFVHHEDVLRAQPDYQPRVVSPQLRKALTARLGFFGRLMLRTSPVRVLLTDPAGNVLAHGGSGEEVKVIGEPEELALFLVGRKPATVDFEGTAAALVAVTTAKRKL